MLSRTRTAGIAKLVLGALFFAQAALAVAACDWGERAPAQAIAAMDAMPCCQEDEAGRGVQASNGNLCLAHCTSDAQAVDTSSPAFPAAPAAVVLKVLPAPVSGCFALRGAPFAPQAFAAPPLTILFQNFRI